MIVKGLLVILTVLGHITTFASASPTSPSSRAPFDSAATPDTISDGIDSPPSPANPSDMPALPPADDYAPGIVDTTVNIIVGRPFGQRSRSGNFPMDDWGVSPNYNRIEEAFLRSSYERVLRDYSYKSMVGLWDVVERFVSGPTNLFGDAQVRNIFEICVKAKLNERGRSDLDWSEEELPMRDRAELRAATLHCIAEINRETAAMTSREQWEEIIKGWLDETER